PFVACGGADLTDQWEHGFDPPSYLRAMDAQGIDAVVLYPSVGLFVPYQPELDAAESADSCRRYDDWVAGCCAADERRLAAVGLAPAGADGGDGEPRARRGAGAPPATRRGLPRVGHRLGAVLALPARRPPRMDGGERDRGAHALGLGVLRPPMHRVERSRRPA